MFVEFSSGIKLIAILLFVHVVFVVINGIGIENTHFETVVEKPVACRSIMGVVTFAPLSFE